MPALKVDKRPLVKCAFPLCDNNFRRWRRRQFCSSACRKNNWRINNKAYYAGYVKDMLAKKRIARRQTHNYLWAVEGKENEAPEYMTVAEAIADSSADTREEIKRMLGIATDPAAPPTTEPTDTI